MDKCNRERPAVLIFARAPIPGRCKTRMLPDLSPEQCAQLQDAMFRDLMLLKEKMEPDVSFWVAYDPAGNEPYFRRFTSRLLLQQGSDLGERICNGLSDLFDRGYGPVVILGTDTPLSEDILAEAFHQLKRHRVVIGPAFDGGYYLLGLQAYERELFKGISWSTNEVFDQTCERVKQFGFSMHLLKPRQDVDYYDDLLTYRHVKTYPYFDEAKKQLIANK